MPVIQTEMLLETREEVLSVLQHISGWGNGTPVYCIHEMALGTNSYFFYLQRREPRNLSHELLSAKIGVLGE